MKYFSMKCVYRNMSWNRVHAVKQWNNGSVTGERKQSCRMVKCDIFWIMPREENIKFIIWRNICMLWNQMSYFLSLRIENRSRWNFTTQVLTISCSLSVFVVILFQIKCWIARHFVCRVLKFCQKPKKGIADKFFNLHWYYNYCIWKLLPDI